LKQCAYTTPTPVQVQALPVQLANRDLMALAETGSGKTAAFVLPILNAMAQNPADPAPREVMTLILAPTRELAIQIDGEVASLSRNMHIRRAVVLGGVSKGPQIHALKRGVHVLVATPGRLLDHVNARHADLRSVRVLVLDEADRMFDMGFVRDIRKIAALLPRQRRTAMFSATMPPEIKKLANELLTDPAFIDLSPKQLVVDRIDQKVMMVRTPEKQSRLHTLLGDPACTRAIIFTRTKRGADRVTDRLGMAGIGAAAIHGNKAQNARQRALADFSAGHVKVLVATDIAARGIDVSNVSHVINFDMPVEAETYVHRIGRTARKGESGIAISLCDPSEKGEIAAIERLMKQKIEVIGDVGGEVLPMPAHRPHRDHDAPRREGSHRKGPRPSHRGQDEGRDRRDHSARGERPARPARAEGDGHKPQHSRAGDAHRTERGQGPHRQDREHRNDHRGPRQEGRSSDRPHAARSGNGQGEGKPFDPLQADARRDQSHTPRQRPDRPQHDRPHHGRPAHETSGRRHEENRPERDAASHGSGKRGDRPAQKPAPHAASAKPAGGHQRGNRNWNGQQPPKFLKQRAR
jgi:ATP-dependent RNA helicase RhlE